MKDYLKMHVSQASYETWLGSTNFITPNVSAITGSSSVLYNPKVNTPSGYNVMDYLFSDGSISPTLDPNKTPVAICVIPTSHMADGKARFMSLKEMTTASTQGSVTHTHIYWQNNSTHVDIQGLTNYDKVATINSDGSFKDLQDYAYLPVDSKEDFTTVYNGDNYYSYSSDTDRAPSPFLSDGITKNDVYFTEGQALCDIDGNANTTTILNADANKYLAAKACRNFAPGTHDGEWYLPAMGELGYVMRQWHAIETAISAATTSNPSCGVQLEDYDYFWSSTEYSSSLACCLVQRDGYFYNNDKYEMHSVRAFVAI